MYERIKGELMEKSKVYFTKDITPDSLIKMYEALGIELKGRVAIKLHSGEHGNQNYLRAEFVKPLIDHIGGTVVETNTAYEGMRNSTEKHIELLKEHKWSEYFNVDILDAENDDIVLDIPNGKAIKKNYIGKNTSNYDSMLVLSHFKGHPMGGFGGALKQLSIGMASSRGKTYIHTAGKTSDPKVIWKNNAPQLDFLQSMADSAGSVVRYFNGNMAFINVMCNMSVDCDCCAVAEDPCIKDIGVLASLDPIAIDRACVDLVKASKDKGRDHLLERITSRDGEKTIDFAYAEGYGNVEYELIDLD